MVKYYMKLLGSAQENAGSAIDQWAVASRASSATTQSWCLRRLREASSKPAARARHRTAARCGLFLEVDEMNSYTARGSRICALCSAEPNRADDWQLWFTGAALSKDVLDEKTGETRHGQGG